MMKLRCLMFGLILSLFGCNKHKLSNSDFIGVWKADDGAEIIINENGTCILKGLNNSIIAIAKDTSEKLNTKGSWKMIENVNNGITGGISTGLKFTYKIMDREGNGGIVFYISGQGFNENKPPWDLFIWKGDPDEVIKYKFAKQ
ncbi:MAG: hypothetical protein ACK5IJ_05960 [Mangrovibacterium sp.]